MIVNVWNILVTLFLCVYFGDGCRFGPEPNCGFPCRCTGDNKCDTDTGECDPGSRCQRVLPDGYGWQGQGCRIGNVAYTNHQNVEQLGQYGVYTASLAVDGNSNPYISFTNGESCAHPYNSASSFAWWWVDLGNIFNIQRITIVNRLSAPWTSQPQEVFNRRSTDYDIKVGNTSNRSQQTLCFHQDKPGNQVQPIETIVCDLGDMVGRYVSFTRTNGTNPGLAAICEFIVIGHMIIQCHSDYCDGNCDAVVGCDKCVAGKMLPDCQHAPEVPPIPTFIGTPDTFTVMWEPVTNLVSGCDEMTSLEITITCANNTQTTVNRTWDLPLTNTGFNYAAKTAVSCDVTLTITNNMGLSSSSFAVEVTTTTTVPPTYESTQSSSYPTTIKVVEKQPNTGQESSPNIAAIAGGSAGGVVLLVLIVVVVVIVMRRRNKDKLNEGRNTPTNASDSTKPTPVYQNTKPTGAEYYNAGFDVTQAAEYAAIDDNQVPKKSGTPGKGKPAIYENTKGTGPHYESLKEVKDQNISPVYQALV